MRSVICDKKLFRLISNNAKKYSFHVPQLLSKLVTRCLLSFCFTNKAQFVIFCDYVFYLTKWLLMKLRFDYQNEFEN